MRTSHPYQLQENHLVTLTTRLPHLTYLDTSCSLAVTAASFHRLSACPSLCVWNVDTVSPFECWHIDPEVRRLATTSKVRLHLHGHLVPPLKQFKTEGMGGGHWLSIVSDSSARIRPMIAQQASR